jgi:ATP-dependent DNA ligase
MAERVKIETALQKPHNFSKKRLDRFLGDYVIAEAKADGLRAIVICTKGKPQAFSSNGCVVSNAEHILEAIKASGSFDGYVLDGEWFCKDWNITQSIVMSQKPHPRAKELRLRVFDMLTIEEWKKKECKRRLYDRLCLLDEILYSSHHKYIQPFKREKLPRKIYSIMSHFQRMKDAGEEGGMYKDSGAFYYFKRHNSWLRIKATKTVDAKIFLAEEENDKNGKPKGRLGSLGVQGKTSDGVYISTSVGTGLKAVDRVKLWADHKKGKLVGRVVEVSYDYITANNAVRFPRFVRMRDDK